MNVGLLPAVIDPILRYLARFETSNADLFSACFTQQKENTKKILDHRLECLKYLKECGYQVGTGVMIGIPGQTLKRSFCMDIRMFQQVDADMIGMGPYLMSEEADLESLGQMENKALFQLF